MMSNVIEFLARLGADPKLAALEGEAFEAAVGELALDDAARTALLARDAGALGDLLGGRPKMICMLFPADDDQKKDDDQDDGDGPLDDEQPQQSVRRDGLH